VLTGAAPEPRDDVFGLACLTYEMLAGAHPYGRRGADVAARAGIVPPAIANLDAGRRASLEAALSLARDGRPAMADFVRALREVARAPGPAVIVPAAIVPAAVPPAAEAAPAAAVVSVPAARSARRPTLPWLAAAAALLALLLGILIGRLQGGGEAPAPAPAPRVEAAAAPPAEAAADAAEALAEPPAAPVSAQAPGAAAAAPATAGLVYFDVPQMTVSKRAVVAAIPLRHLSREARPVSVEWRAVDGSARAGRDYGGPASGVERFVEGNSFRILYVPIVQVPGSGRDRSFTVELTRATAGVELGPTPRVEVTILGEY
jgi:hypothetical protein